MLKEKSIGEENLSHKAAFYRHDLPDQMSKVEKTTLQSLDVLPNETPFLSGSSHYYRVTGNAQILEKALFPKLKLTKDLN